jgi:hypothetical protein
LIVTAWIFLLLASGLPRIILQEVFGFEVSLNLSSLIAATVILIGLALTLIWDRIRRLRQFFILFLVLVGVEWFVYTKVDQLSFYQTWLNHPSFSVYMFGEQSLRLIVTLVMIATLFVMKKRQDEFFLVKLDINSEV